MSTKFSRGFISHTAVNPAGASAVAPAADAPLSADNGGWPIGSQIYPHRARLKDFPAFCRTMSELGVTRLELCSPIAYGADFASLADGKAVRKILDDHGMKAESAHFGLNELRTRQPESIAWAHDVGIRQMLTASLGDGAAGHAPTLDQVKRAAEAYNGIAAIAAKAGLQQGLHNEAYERAMVDGQRTYDRLFVLLDPALVKFQFQMSEVAFEMVGADYFTKYPGRFISMHVQDIDMEAAQPPPIPAGGRAQVAVGQGSVDWVATFKAAKAAGVTSYYIEQTMELTRESVAALKAMKLSPG